MASFIVSQAPFSQTVLSGAALAYSGPWAFWQNTFSVLAVNTSTGAASFPTGLSKPPHPPFRPGAGPVVEGDCWQSVSGIAASKDTPKWLIATGAPNLCDLEGLQVWKWEAGAWRWKGLITARIQRTATPRINGDVAYAAEPGTTNPKWVIFDLNALSVVGTTEVTPPAEIQTEANGSLWNLTIVTAQNWTVASEDAPVLPTFCPKDILIRQQVAAMLYNAINWAADHPGQKLVPPAEQQFSDVPMDSIFAPSINALAVAGIVAGKPECDPPCPE